MSMTLVPKVVLKQKDQSAVLPEVKQVKIVAHWTGKVDFDLMAFGVKKDGTKFSIYSKLLGGSQGYLSSFPFMQLSDDAGVGAKGGDCEEKIILAQIDPSVDEIHFILLNYTDASSNNVSSFSNYDATINMINDKGENLIQGQLNDTTSGVAAWLCTIKNGAVCGSFINKNKVMTLQEFVQIIPGADALVK